MGIIIDILILLFALCSEFASDVWVDNVWSDKKISFEKIKVFIIITEVLVKMKVMIQCIQSIFQKVSKTTIGRMFLWKSAVCNGKNSRFIKEQEVRKLLSLLGIITLLSKIALLGNILF